MDESEGMGIEYGMPDGITEEQLPRYYNEQEASFSQWQLNPDSTIEEIVHNLRGEIKNHETGEWYKPDRSKCRVNDMGINDILSTVRFVVNKDTALSVISEKDIYFMCRGTSHNLINKLDARMEDYGIDETDFPSLVNDIMNTIYIYLCRAKDGETLHGIQRIYKFLERTGEKSKEKTGNFNLGLFGKSKGGK